MTNNRKWKISPLEILKTGPVIPVIVIEKIEDAVPMARALLSGGVKVLEITLRTPVAIDAIRAISAEVPDAIVGAGTVLTPADLQQVEDAGGVFALSPGFTPSLLEAANDGPMGFIPGISTASELMMGLELGYDVFKFFPAEAAGGVNAVKSIGGPFPQCTFCPTGGISPDNYRDYLALKNVACVGGSWLVPSGAVKKHDWQKITDLAAEAVAGAGD